MFGSFICIYQVYGICAGNGLDRWNYYEDPDEPTAPSYALIYTYRLYLKMDISVVLPTFHFFFMFLVKCAMSQEFKEERMFNKCIHVLQNLNLSFPFVDWGEKMVSGEEFKQTLRTQKWRLLAHSLLTLDLVLSCCYQFMVYRYP